ncbi:MAG: hypothetical protein RMJ56_10710 [Gemmataceae bacterium]|nr:hypothetical protein [Gemmata sp.]MDW8198060.1 hypothetical protein [Gemmataceae bacterium]
MSLFGLDLDTNAVSAEYTQRVLVTLLVAATTSAVTFLVTWWWAQRRAARQWQTKEFLDRIIVSLNLFADGYLKIRTVFERSLEEIFLNKVAIAKVQAAARATTVANPIMPIAPTDRWYLLNFVLNAVAEHFVTGHVRRDAGLPVTTVKYALFLTCEKVGEERIHKVRAMLLRHDLLENFPYPDSLPQLENPWHEYRIKTLRIAAQLYKTEPDHFLMLEVSV